MSGGMFLMHETGELVPMRDTAYDTESQLQEWLARYPDLLPGDQVDAETPRKWLLVCREARIPEEEEGAGRWSVDHLFLDQEGIPTLIEVKRSSDSRIRREVVGQMLDYAANAAAYWKVQTIRSMLEDRCRVEKREVPSEMKAVLQIEDVEEFWASVAKNLESKKIRLIFVADEIPKELRRIVEFLNEDLANVEVLALEVKRFEGSSGTKVRTIVSKVIGQTSLAESRKRPAAGMGETQVSTDEMLLMVERASGVDAKTLAKQAVEWALKNGMSELRLSKRVSFLATDGKGEGHRLFTVGMTSKCKPPEGRMSFRMDMLGKSKAFANPENKAEFLRRVNEASGGNLVGMDGTFQHVPLAKMNTPKMEAMLEVMSWAKEKIRNDA
jgi:ribosomal protein L30E